MMKAVIWITIYYAIFLFWGAVFGI